MPNPPDIRRIGLKRLILTAADVFPPDGMALMIYRTQTESLADDLVQSLCDTGALAQLEIAVEVRWRLAGSDTQETMQGEWQYRYSAELE